MSTRGKYALGWGRGGWRERAPGSFLASCDSCSEMCGVVVVVVVVLVLLLLLLLRASTPDRRLALRVQFF